LNIEEIIKSGESETLEFKKSLSKWREIIKTVSAFSNTKGGLIIVGVDDNGKIVGVKVGKGTIEDLTNKILQNTEPRIYPEISLEDIDVENKKILTIKVERFPYDVVLAFGRPYKRVGKSTVKMAKDEYKRRILEIHKKEVQFDGQPLADASLKDINEENLKAFVKKAKEKRNIDIEEFESSKSILRKLKLIKGDHITNAGILLFGKNPNEFFEHAKIKCIRFKGYDVTGEIIDLKEISGNLFTQVEE